MTEHLSPEERNAFDRHATYGVIETSIEISKISRDVASASPNCFKQRDGK